MTERRKRITASNVGSIAKMRKTTKRCNKVKSLLYSSFRGNQATQYGVDNEVKCPYSAKDISIDDACSMAVDRGGLGGALAPTNF